eukprot:TRINITY_DN18554_c0_g1_i1.p1 TRINITY_DN18554_c0_g1~~TRINITY_DN18554_c0_g1_i1.p1  ORF type:complete len:199 (+),score=42.84 TRINITY_DN18554_c0_g1_i1:152-748(+)
MNRKLSDGSTIIEMGEIGMNRPFRKDSNHTSDAKEKSQLTQILLLLQKNLIIFKRNRRVTLFQLLTPLLVSLLLVTWQNVSERIFRVEIIDPDVESQESMYKCQVPDDCISIGYGVIGPREDWIDFVMERVAAQEGMKFGQEVRLISHGNAKDFMDYIQDNWNKTQVGIIFCTEKWPIMQSGLEVPCKFEEVLSLIHI